ncbi:MAG: glutamate-5-semialdehyde dehydrogenase [Actinomycetaceae bacterium]|nr:glutamate-5-semialdehyde dehydrogenase [Actinomycetaceae bacterium]
MTATSHNNHAHNSSSVKDEVLRAAQRGRRAAVELAKITAQQKNNALHAIAQALITHADDICAANAKDYQREESNGMKESLLDRLKLTSERVGDIAEAVRTIATLTDPVGEVINGYRLPNGLHITLKRVPLGVVGMIYEARPNVTVDAACLALKAGNASLLRGGSAALESNMALVKVIRQALEENGLPSDCVQTLDEYGREGATEMMKARGYVDVVIPRGGAGLINSVVDNARVPVIETGIGNCHIYVDASADMEKALSIVLNAKTQRLGVCNAAETLLLDKHMDDKAAVQILSALMDAGVRIHGDPIVVALMQALGNKCGVAAVEKIVVAQEDDWAKEYLSADIAVRIVDGVDEAIEHIRKYSSGHTEAIVADSSQVISRFVSAMDSAAVAVNASTRFTDGGELGLGAEIGISTQKLHARGPMGLSALTTMTWIIEGDGHIRQ